MAKQSWISDSDQIKKDNGKFILLLVIGAISFVLLVVLAVFALGNAPNFSPSAIAVIPLKGEISNEGDSSFSSLLSANEIISIIDEADNDPRVKVILIDIDSPGGEVVASKHIAYKVRGAKKPVYAYINSIGASGGYYVAAASDYIMADEDSITGSIGVISILFNAEEFLEKIGIEATVLKEGELKDTGSPFNSLSEDENKLIQAILAQAFTHFKRDVLEFRKDKLTRAQLEEIADGRILTGKQAFESRLVDELLTREEAIDKISEFEKIKKPELISYGQREVSLFDLFFVGGKAFFEGATSSVSSNALNIKFR